MDINDLTIGQLKDLQSLISQGSNKKDNIFDRYIGKYVICRTRNEGINAGKVVVLDETGVVLEDSRRLYYHKPINKNVSWYEGVAKYGLDSSSKIGTEIEKILVEDYSLTVCTKEAEESIRKAKDNAQS